MGERPVAPTAPELVLETDAGSTVMSPSRDYHVGRDPLSDIVIDDARVSWHHAVLRPEADHWTIEDEDSTNGTYADGRRDPRVGRRPRQRHPVRQSRGRPACGSRRPVTRRPPAAGAATARPPSPCRPPPAPSGSRPPYGRCPPAPYASAAAPDNDLVIDDLVVSRRHAELRAQPDGGYEIVDLGSHNGTYLNGQPVDRAPVVAR